MKENSLHLAGTIWEAITTSDEWGDVTMTDPMIRHRDAELTAILKRGKKLMPRDVYFQLEDAAYGLATAYADAGILFGLRIAAAFRELVEDPAALSGHILKGLKERENACEA